MQRMSLVLALGAAWLAGSLTPAARGDQGSADGLQFCPVDRAEAVSSAAEGHPAIIPWGVAPADAPREEKSATPAAWTNEAADEQPAAAEPAPCPPRQPWHLPQPFERYGIHLSGWLEQGITFNDDHPADHFNGPVATNDQDHEWQMNQLWLTLERPVKTGGCGWDIGGRIDMMLGTDWRFGINNGLENRINGFNDQTYGMVIPQAYAEIGWNNLSLKLGHFAAILDYEMVPAPANPFYSHSYCYGYCVPQLVTGWLADYKVNEQFSLQGGMDRGWSQFEDNNEVWDFMGGFRYRTCDDRTNVAFAVSNGPQDPAGQNDRFVYSLVVKEQLNCRLQYVFVHDLGIEQATAVDGGQAEWYDICQYLLYTINPKWSANLRMEWLRDEDGARIAGPGNIPGVRAWDGHSFPGNFYEVTAGLNWRPRPNMLCRPELRYDWYSGQTGFVNGTPGMLPFNAGKSNSQLLAACDFIVLF
jgi:hypothetical protein